MFFVHIWWWFQHVTGVDYSSGPAYGFWSGFGSDIGELAILGGIVQLYRQHNCAIKGCYRIGHYEVQGTKYKTCHKHATGPHHTKLIQDHKDKHPVQHAFLNRTVDTESSKRNNK